MDTVGAKSSIPSHAHCNKSFPAEYQYVEPIMGFRINFRSLNSCTTHLNHHNARFSQSWTKRTCPMPKRILIQKHHKKKPWENGQSDGVLGNSRDLFQWCVIDACAEPQATPLPVEQCWAPSCHRWSLSLNRSLSLLLATMVNYEVEMWFHCVINIFFLIAASFFLHYDPDYSTPN